MNQQIAKLVNEVKKVIKGKDDVIIKVVSAMIAGGHILLEDIPGVGKTTLAVALSKSLSMDYHRVQFTPDVLPSDLVGFSMYNNKTGTFEYKEGSVYCNFLLADEINRTSPKTQAAMLEAMAEGKVSIDGRDIELPKPFMVIATQNPASYTGTYPLPEAQMDRFMMRLSIGYPDSSEELRMIRSHMEGAALTESDPVLSPADIEELREAVAAVRISDGILSYMQRIADATRHDSAFALGASPRALIHMMQAARARAVLCGRDYCLPDDVKKPAVNVLAHRLVLSTEMKLQKKTAAEILYALILGISVPVE